MNSNNEPRRSGWTDFLLNKVLLPFATWILGLIVALIGTQWSDPDLRYEVNPPDRTGGAMSVKLENYGRAVAKDIRFAAHFPKPLIKPPQTDDDSTPVTIMAGGPGKDSVAVSIDRLVPGQKLHIQFTIEEPGPSSDKFKNDFVKSITYEKGHAETGVPLMPTVIVGLILGCLLVFSFLFCIAIVGAFIYSLALLFREEN